LAASFSFDFFEVGPVEIDEAPVSSTLIRALIQDGDLEGASHFLGRLHSFYGTVVKGDGRGSQIGFPTANLEPHSEVLPPTGVYAVFVNYKKNTYNGVANIGISPSFGDNLFTIEAHIINFNKNIYGEKLGITFIKKIREEKKFTNLSELSEQIKKDIKKGEEILLKWQN